jgi:hypothetical protein
MFVGRYFSGLWMRIEHKARNLPRDGLGGVKRCAHRPAPLYAEVRSAAFAIYAETFFDVGNGDPAQLAKNLDWELKYMAPFRAASIERVRRELPSVETVKVPGTHKDFVFASREQMVSAMQRFLGGTDSGLLGDPRPDAG